ncbi:Baseplate J-like protein [compost metagenome]
MYEDQTYEVILQRMLNRVSDNVDKREGSIIFDALAPAAAELAQLYIELDVNYNLSFADTASGEYLTRKAAEFGVNRNTATSSVRRGMFYTANNALMDVPIGTRFSVADLTYTVSQRISAGTYQLTCESTGTIGNEQFGSILPINYVANLARAELVDVLVPGEDEETDEALQQRLYATVSEPAFGGNVEDYKNKISAIPGVGATKVYPAWNGGGTVKCTIIASDWGVPSTTLISDVQEYMDPLSTGQGIGQAPIGHKVTIAGVTSTAINISTKLTLATDVTLEQVQQDIEDVLNAYLIELRKDWANQTQIVVRIAQVDAKMLSVLGVEDVADTTINTSATNLTLGSDQIPIFGAVFISEV